MLSCSSFGCFMSLSVICFDIGRVLGFYYHSSALTLFPCYLVQINAAHVHTFLFIYGTFSQIYIYLFICLTVVSFLSCLYRLADLVGFGVAVATGKQYYQSYPERCYKSLLTAIMLEENRTGSSISKIRSTQCLVSHG